MSHHIPFPQLFSMPGVEVATKDEILHKTFITSRGMKKMSPKALGREERNLPDLKISQRK